MKKPLISVAIASVLSLGVMAQASAYETFTVDETPFGGGLLEADKLNGGYVERISFDGSGGFATNAYADFGLYYLNDSIVTSVINSGYGLYALFDATGTVAPIVPGLFSFTSNTGSFSLYLDPNRDTTKAVGTTGSDSITLGNTGDDYLIASASVMSSGTGVLLSGTGGFFDLVFTDFTLEDPAGMNFFVSPNPFYLRVNVDGDFDTFNVVGNQTIRGDVSAVFIPEPGSIALMGLGLLGMGFAVRRRKAA